MGQGHGWEGAVLKLFRGKDFTFTVTGAEDVTPYFRRLHPTDGGMLAATGVHPDTTTTRSLTSYVRKELALPRRRVHALGYWRAA